MHPALRVRDVDEAQHLDGFFERRAAPEPFMLPHRLGDLRAHGIDRVQRGHRLLEDDADFLAADGTHLVGAQRHQIAAPPQDLAGDDPSGWRRDQLQDRERRDGFAAARFADDAESFAAVDREIDAVDRMHHAVFGREMRLQPAYFEQVLAGAISGTILQIHSTLRGSSVSRSPSPI